MKKSIVGTIVTEYLEDDRWRNLPSRTLAKKIFEENKAAFNNINHVRTVIRYYRGTIGNINRSKLTDKRFIDYNPYKLPESDETEFYPFKLPSKANNILLLSDIHIPYHSVSALTAAIEWGLQNNINAIVLNGDIWDCYKGSRFNPDPRKRGINEEREMVVEFLQELNKIFPDAYKFYKIGNHEERWENYLKIKAPEVMDMNEFRTENVLRLKENNYDFITVPKQILQAGSLNIVHGHEFGFSVFSPVNVARGLFLRAKTSAICGHHHQVSEHTEPNLNGKVITTWSQGCLSELHPDYLPVNKWSHGFANIQWDEDEFQVKNMRINNGKIL